MRIATALAGAAVALTLAAVSTPSIAAPALPNLAPAGGYVINVADWDGDRHGGRVEYRHEERREEYRHEGRRHHGWGHRWNGGGWNQCRAWRNECADRWPRLGWRYQRCLNNHGC